ncbi:YqiA/YcfP family alpha/beta fold hydrolase [uncultured Microbulbifer sp.]|uniref:YqiA/YcfP family alpha/beta fold hydrolase n=1 Tax=uncultured Microbulbifer sp. TaxID=348147 RepID=UPI00262D0DC4|nr:YqiA/YcfP family alpha/beta fold hydrolase [uncultured Microbulbifer sp.]
MSLQDPYKKAEQPSSGERPLLVYLHGFLSSPQSYKCQELKTWLMEFRPDIVFYAPLISPYPEKAAMALGAAVGEFVARHTGPIGLVGSSMGGFWSTWLAEQHQLPAVVVNPAVTPSRFMPGYLGQDLKPYSGEMQTYRLQPADVDKMQQLEAAIPTSLSGRYWLLAQRGDETLDCREAEAFYRNQRQTIEDGGDHSFQGFARYAEALVDFLFPNK